MGNLRGKLTYANVVSTVALFLVVAGGTAFASQALVPKNSVGTSQLKAGSVTPEKLSKSSKQRLKGATGAQGATGAPGADAPQAMPAPTSDATGTGAGETYLVKASASMVPAVQGSFPLTGLTTWTPPGAPIVGLISGSAFLKLAQHGNGACQVIISLYDDGTWVAGTGTESTSPTLEAQSVPIAMKEVKDEPGSVHELTAAISFEQDCSAESTIESLEVEMIPHEPLQ
jgi:hypothetical protein